MLILFVLCSGTINVRAQASAEVEKANKAGKTVFLVAFNSTGVDRDNAVTIANSAKKLLPTSTTVVQMNTTDAANTAFVAKLRLAGAPLPLILVLDKNGNAAGGLALKDATSQKLVDLVPSPKYSEVLDALSDGKSIYVVAYRESMASKKNIIDNCYLACNKMENKSVIVKLDMDDKKESKFLQALKCNMTATEPVTYVINAAGQVTGTYTGLADVNTLVGSAKKVASGGCCPGSAKTCGTK